MAEQTVPQRYSSADSNTAGAFIFDVISTNYYAVTKLAFGAVGTATYVSSANPLPVTGVITGDALTALQVIDDVVYADDADWTDGTSKHVLVGGLYQSTPQSITDGDVGPFQVTAQGFLFVGGAHANSLGKAEDAAHVSGDVGVYMLAVRDDTLGAHSGTDGDYESLHTNANGALWSIDVNSASALTALQLIDDPVLTDDSAFTPATSKVMMAGFEYDDTTPDSVDEGDAGAARMSANRCQYVMLRDNAGNERGLNVDGSGNITVNVTGTVTVGSHAVTNAGTFAVQVDGAALTSLQLLDDAIFVDGSAFTPNSSKVLMIGAECDETAAVTVDEGDAGALRMTVARGLHVNLRDSSGNEVSVVGGTQYNEDDAHTSGSKVTGAGVVRQDTLASLCGTDGDYSLLSVNATGALYVVPTGGTVSTVTTISQFGGNNINLGNGAVGTGTLRVTLANDSTGIVSLTTSTASIGKLTANSGVDIGDVDILSIAAGDNNIGNVDIVTMPNVTLAAGTNTNEVVGDAAHDAAIAGNPLRVGARAETALSGITLVSDGDTTDLYAGVDGVLITRPYCNLEDIVTATPVAITDGSSTSVIASQGAGVKFYLTSAIIANSSATDVTVNLRDGTAGAVKATFPVPAAGGVIHAFPVPLPFSADTAVAADPSAAASTITITLVGFKSKV